MNLPSITVLIPTFGRTRQLREAVYSALNQDYAGKVDVVVLNDFDQQHIRFDHERVQVVNLRFRCSTLGAKREMMLHMTKSDMVTFLDDDDIMLPWHLRNIKQSTVAMLPTMIFEEGDVGNISYNPVLGGILGVTVDRRIAARLGFEAIDIGEDNMFRQALLAHYGQSVHRSDVPSYLWRRYLPGIGHISHMVKVDASPDPERFVKGAYGRVESGAEPAGSVTLTPAWTKDYWQLVSERFPEDIPKRTP